jgi:lysophospholipase L1-like esterase
MKRLEKYFKSEKPVKWLFYGDSITHGVVHTFGWRDYPGHFAERVRCEMGRTLDLVLNSAISGHTTVQLLETFDWRVGQFKPDVAFLMIGMNDCSDLLKQRITAEDFEANLNELVDRFEKLGTLTVMQTTCPIIPNKAPEREPHLPGYMEIIRKVASERNLPLIDHYAYWQQNSAKQFYWMSNAFHPNNAGHIAFAHLLFKDCGIWDDNSLTCKLFAP